MKPLVFAPWLVLAARVAAADPQLIAPPTVPSPAPELAIESPTLDEKLDGNPSPTPDNKFTTINCLQDSRTFGIKLSAKNWSVKPGGQGVLIVVDGVYATNVHDLTKKVKLADFTGYEGYTAAEKMPLTGCGFHWIAVMPTASDGRMLPVPPVFSWWENAPPANIHNAPEQQSYIDARHKSVEPVVNWPLLGKAFYGTQWEGSEDKDTPASGFVLTDPKHARLDWTMTGEYAHDPGCSFSIVSRNSRQSWDDEVKLPSTGTIDLPNSYLGRAIVINAQNCRSRNYEAKLWDKAPPAIKHGTFPVPGLGTAKDYWNSAGGRKQVKGNRENLRHRCDKGDSRACDQL